jgi:hypothetical protein
MRLQAKEKGECWKVRTALLQSFTHRLRATADWLSNPKKGLRGVTYVMGPQGKWVKADTQPNERLHVEKGLAAH